MGLDDYFSICNYSGMGHTQKRGRGRPPIYGTTLERVEILVPAAIKAEAVRLSEKTGVSMSEVYRTWIEAGIISAGTSGR